MSLVAVPQMNLWLPAVTATGLSVMLLDANSEKAAWVGYAPKTGTITKIGFRTGTVTLGDTVDVRLETVGADGNPSGSLFGTTTNVSQVILATEDNTWFEVTLTAAASVTKGDKIAIVVALPAVAVGNLEIYRGNVAAGPFPSTAHYTGTWAKSGNPLHGFLGYGDGTFPFTEALFPHVGVNVSFNNTSSPDERGAKITVPFACKVAGIWVANGSITALGDFDVVLYSAADSVLESASMDGDLTSSAATSGRPFVCMFDTEVTLTAGQVVRAVKKPTSATNINIAHGTLQAAAKLSATAGGTAVVHTSRTDAGAWTDDDTLTPFIGLIVSALDDGANRAGGVRVLGSAVAGSVI